jgi:hypothetical protein
VKSNSIFRLMAASVALFFALSSCNEAPKSATAEELSQMNRDFVKALNVKDAVAVANCYTEDATVLSPNEAPCEKTCQHSKILGRCNCRRGRMNQVTGSIRNSLLNAQQLLFASERGT